MTFQSSKQRRKFQSLNRSLRTMVFCNLLLILSQVILQGCGGADYVLAKATESTIDVTSRDEYWKEFKRNAEYKLIEDCFLTEYSGWSTRLAIARTADFPGGMEVTSNEYLKNPEKWPRILGVIEEGTRLRCTKLLSHGAIGYGRALFLYAEILDGPHRGKLVDINSLGVPDRSKTAPGGEMLRRPNLQLVMEND